MAESPSITKAVVPAAGLGTRFLPATKATPKEILPVIDTPTIQLVVEEAVAAGLTDILMITGRGKGSIEDHFDRNHELEEALAAKGDEAGLELVRRSAELAEIHYIRQGEPRGLGHAVLCAADHVGDVPFAVLLGDDFIDKRDPLLARMIDARHRYGGSIVALMEVEPQEVSAYGSAAIKPTDEDDVVAVTDLVEKPDPSEAPSNWIVIGRYICDPAIFGVLRQTPPGRGGEIQLTDALRTLARTDRGAGSRVPADRAGGTGPSDRANGAGPGGTGPGGRRPGSDGGGVHGVLFRGRRYDTGNKLDYLRTMIKFACDREDIAPEFVPWLRSYLDNMR